MTPGSHILSQYEAHPVQPPPCTAAGGRTWVRDAHREDSSCTALCYTLSPTRWAHLGWEMRAKMTPIMTASMSSPIMDCTTITSHAHQQSLGPMFPYPAVVDPSDGRCT